VSLIESALQKLRRVGEGTREPGVLAPRLPSVALAAKGLAATIAAEPQPEEAARRIAVDLRALRDAGYLPEERLERRFADHFRHIKRPLIEKALDGDAERRIIMVTSALPGDGKTFVSINLALSIARERDVSVLLVDADAPKARVSEVFGLRREPGLIDALTDQYLEVESLIQHTDVRGLEILPAGRFVENATELIASARMAQIMARIAARNPSRLVLFDSAPLLVSSEARALAQIPGQIVLVARAGTTPSQAVSGALAQIDRSRLSGLVVNDTPLRLEGDSYYGYSGYGGGGKEQSSGG
jgi:protein-tyrosine kinase